MRNTKTDPLKDTLTVLFSPWEPVVMTYAITILTKHLTKPTNQDSAVVKSSPCPRGGKSNCTT